MTIPARLALENVLGRDTVAIVVDRHAGVARVLARRPDAVAVQRSGDCKRPELRPLRMSRLLRPLGMSRRRGASRCCR